ncbi:hypothetical protein C7S17_6992 [Burkholderia thailandensis]|nr:hypothetical protein [Burkholderia thailandensis]
MARIIRCGARLGAARDDTHSYEQRPAHGRMGGARLWKLGGSVSGRAAQAGPEPPILNRAARRR